MYRTGEAMKLLGVCRPMIYKWIKSGKIKAVKIGREWRIPESEIRKLIGDRWEKRLEGVNSKNMREPVAELSIGNASLKFYDTSVLKIFFDDPERLAVLLDLERRGLVELRGVGGLVDRGDLPRRGDRGRGAAHGSASPPPGSREGDSVGAAGDPVAVGDSSLPDFIRDNPWIDVLMKRR